MSDRSVRVVRGAALMALVLGMWSPSVMAQDEQPAGDAEGAPEPRVLKPRFLMLPTGSMDGQVTSIVTDRLDGMTRKRLEEQRRVILMPSFEQIRKELSAKGNSSAVILEAESSYASGIGLLTAGQNQEAVQAFQRAVGLMEENIAQVTNYNVLADAMSNLAVSNHRAGYDLDGRQWMKKFAHIRPDAKLDPEKYPKDLLDLFDSERKKVKKGGPGKISVTSSSPGARVFIDGEDKGEAPVDVTDVGFGYHYLVIKDAMGGAAGQVLKVKGRGKSQSVALDVDGGGDTGGADEGMPSYYTDLMVQLGARQYDAGELAPYLTELAKQTGAERIGWMTMFKRGMGYGAAAFVYWPGDEKIYRLSDVNLNFELSNLSLGVNKVATELAAYSVEESTEAFTTTELVAKPKPKVVVVTPPSGGDPKDPVVLVTPGGPGEKKTGPLVPPPDVRPPGEDDDEGFPVWTAVGIGAGVLVVGGLIVGGALLFGGGGDAGGSGFSAEVSW